MVGDIVDGARSSTGANSSVAAVIVTFNPCEKTLTRCVEALANQVDLIVIVDNASEQSPEIRLRESVPTLVRWLALGRNMGIAHAQNQGINLAFRQKCGFVILFDQDSIPPRTGVIELVNAATRLRSKGIPLGAVVPKIVDNRHSPPSVVPFFRGRSGRAELVYPTGDDAVLPIDTAISSGCLIPRSAIEVIGGMTEELFIDLVDIDWFFRARARGFDVYCVCTVALDHQLGGAPKKILGKELAIHSPLRNYYYFRNAIWLFRQEYVPRCWKFAVIRQLVLRYMLYPVMLKPRVSYLGMMSMGIWHGLIGRLGAR